MSSISSKVSIPQDDFSELLSVRDAISFVQRLGACHRCYTRYMTVDRICEIIENGRMWFNRADSNRFDDAQELEKYGYFTSKKRLFYSCFSYCSAENAAMWGLYCPPTYQAIRISVGAKSINSWLERLNDHDLSIWKLPRKSKSRRKTCGRVQLESAAFNDIVYASVRKDEDEPERSNTLFWNNLRTHKIPHLDSEKNSHVATGALKDYEWNFEHEARLWIRTKISTSFDAVLVEIPDSFLKSLRFVLSPWCTTNEESFVVTRLHEAFEKRFKGKNPFRKEHVRKSNVSGALKNWAKTRGLS